MDSGYKPKIVLILAVVLAAGITYWGLAYNQGEITVNSDIRPFIVTGVYDEATTCDDTECTFVVKPKAYDLMIQAEGFTSENIAITAKRGRTAEVEYNPLRVPQFELTADEDTYDALVYSSRQPNGEVDIWLRDMTDDQKLTTFSGDRPTSFYYEPANPKLLAETDTNQVVEIDVVSQRKRVVKLPKEWDKWDLLGDEWVVWLTEDNHFYAPFGYSPDTKLALPLKEIDHIVAVDDDTALFISQVTLSGAKDSSDNTLVGLLDTLQLTDDGNITTDQPYFLYQLNLLTDEMRYLTELEWTGENDIAWQKKYQEEDLAPVIYLEVDGDLFTLDLE